MKVPWDLFFFLKKFLFIFNRRIIALQYWVGFAKLITRIDLDMWNWQYKKEKQ